MIEESKIRFIGRTPKPRSVFVGMYGEHNAQTVRLEGLPEIENGIYTVNLVLPDGTVGDVLNLDESGTFSITRTYSQQSGQVKCWAAIQVDTNLVWKSDIFILTIEPLPAIEEAIEHKYPSAIEDALIECGNEVAAAEAWAVGQRKGVDVEAGDETYHNNSKYYAGLAEQGAASAGWIEININSNGHLIMERTNNAEIDFSISDTGHLILEV